MFSNAIGNIMGLFTKKHQEELINLNNQLDFLISHAPLLIDDNVAQAEIKDLYHTKEIKHLKKKIWKFYHK